MKRKEENVAAKAKKKTVVKAKSAKKVVAKKAKPLMKAAKVSKTAKKNAAAKKSPAKRSAKPVAAKKSIKPKAKSAAPTFKPTVKSAVKSPVKSTVKWEDFITPLDDRLIVESEALEKMTAGGLYIPDTVADTSGNYKGKVLIVGRGSRNKFGKIKPMDVKAGDTVLFAEHSGTAFDLNGIQVRILRESEVLGIVSK